MEKKIDIATLYASEIGRINDKLRELRTGRFAGYNGNGSSDGFLENKIDELTNLTYPSISLRFGILLGNDMTQWYLHSPNHKCFYIQRIH